MLKFAVRFVLLIFANEISLTVSEMREGKPCFLQVFFFSFCKEAKPKLPIDISGPCVQDSPDRYVLICFVAVV